jgi:hypothetical protein
MTMYVDGASGFDGSSLNERLANFAKTCEGRANSLRQQAAEQTELHSGWDAYDNATKVKVKGILAEAAAWEARAREAEKGFMLVDDADAVFMMGDYRSLISECAASYRCVTSPPPTGPPFVIEPTL